MTTLRHTFTNSGADRDARLWGIEGAPRLYVVLGAMLVSLVTFLLCSLEFQLGNAAAILIACLPTALAIGVARYQQGHSPGHLVDLIEMCLRGRSFGPPPPDSPNFP